MTVTLFKALADETRLRLMRILVQHDLSVNELVRILQMGQSRISRHLRILADAGLLTSRRDGLCVIYQANSEKKISTFLSSVRPYLDEIAESEIDTLETDRLLEEKNRRTQEFFNTIADDWDDLNRKLLGTFDLPQAACDAMPDNCTLAVDLGCGTGAVLAKMLTKTRCVVGVDGSQRMLDLCRRRFMDRPDTDKISLRLGDLAHLPLRDQEADFACINLVLHHLEKPSQALTEARRILTSRGRLFIADFDRHDDESMRDKYGDRWLGFEEGAIAIQLREAGFTRTHIHKERIHQGLTLLLVTSFVDSSFYQ